MKLNSIRGAVVNCEVSIIEMAKDKVKSLVRNVNGSETTEKIGWIVGAAIILGLAVTALKPWATTNFPLILKKASDAITALS